MNTISILELLGLYIRVIVITIAVRYIRDKIKSRNKNDKD